MIVSMLLSFSYVTKLTVKFYGSDFNEDVSHTVYLENFIPDVSSFVVVNQSQSSPILTILSLFVLLLLFSIFLP